MSDGEMTAALLAAIGTLFSALLYALRQRADDWRALYEQERADRLESSELALEGIRQANEALRHILAIVQALPKRRTDWEGQR